MSAKRKIASYLKGGMEGPAGPANAVPLSEAVCNAGPLFDRSHTHMLEVTLSQPLHSRPHYVYDRE